MFSILLCWLGLAFAVVPADHSIIVEDHRNIEVYVAPIQIRNEASEIEAVISEYSVYGFASMHSRHVQVSNGFGGYQSILSRTGQSVKVYNKDTIKYIWDDCDYEKDPKGCTYKNSHYLLETYITVDVNQIVVEMFLYDPDLQIISRGEKTSNLKVKYIKQQEFTSQTIVIPGGNQSVQDCNEGSCRSVSQQHPATITDVSKPKEGMPLRWEIPHKLLNFHIKQASLGLWIGTKIK